MPTTVASYLIERLKNAGVEHAFGVPGDYVLTFMDRLIASDVEFIGTCNELNAGYAADAYARIRGIGCIVVTWGVGGFSAMNAVAGAYAEQVPLVVLVGGPRTNQRRSSTLLHHGVGEFSTMQHAYAHITAASVLLDDADDAPHKIDRALARCLSEKRPIMIEIPVDIVDQACESPRKALTSNLPKSDKDSLSEAIDEVVGLLSVAKRPVILGGVELHRYGLMKEFMQLVDRSKLPVATTLLGKTVISELHRQAIGVYEGSMSRKAVRDIVESSDVLLCLGAWISDINFGVFTGKLEGRQLILANSGRLKISQHVYERVWIGDVVQDLADRMPTNGLLHPPFESVSAHQTKAPAPSNDKALTVNWVMRRVNDAIGDDITVIAETGDSLFAAADLVMHHDVGFIGQAFYLSIGYALPAILGASLADPGRRALALIGDGALQMSVQELSSLCRRHIPAILLIMNNNGYTTERVIHEGPYNEIQQWAYHKLPEVFGGGWGRRVETEAELDTALDEAYRRNDGPAVIEVMLDKMDMSDALRRLGAELSPDKK